MHHHDKGRSSERPLSSPHFSPQLFAYVAKSSNFAPSNETIYKDGTTNTNKIIK